VTRSAPRKIAGNATPTLGVDMAMFLRFACAPIWIYLLFLIPLVGCSIAARGSGTTGGKGVGGSATTTIVFGRNERSALRDAYHDRRWRQSFLASLVVYDEWPWPVLQQSWFRFRILVYGPVIRQRLVHIKEIGPASFESPYHLSARDIMPALLYAVA
jgi:hypothetical protein